MSIPRSQTVELCLAETGTELKPAVEAAQYARLISHDPPASTGEARAMVRFVEAFTACAEAWEELDPIRRRGTLANLSAELDALEMYGLFVHWAAIRRGIAGSRGPVSMPLAVLTISRTNLPTARMRLPGELEVDPQRDLSIH